MSEKEEWKLKPFSELRMEVAHRKSARITLKEGSSEIFGAELGKEAHEITGGSNVAIYTYEGCVIEAEGEWASAYVASENPAVFFHQNVHHALQHKRNQALASNPGEPSSARGPRVMVVGPTDAGKSSLVSLLINYAVREGSTPVFVELDVGQGQLAIPGCISAAKAGAKASETIGYTTTSPLSMWFGHESPSANLDLYRAMLASLAKVLDDKCDTDPALAAAGFVVNTCGWVDGDGLALLFHAVDVFSIDHVLVLGQERLEHRFSTDLAKTHPQAEVLGVPKSAGVVARDKTFRRSTRNNRIGTYFNGLNGELCPFTVVLNFGNEEDKAAPYRIYRIGGGPQAPLHALPIGAMPTIDPVRPSEVTLNEDLKHCVLGVCWTDSPDGIVANNIAGFVSVIDVDVEKQRLTVLAPSAGQVLPSKILLLGGIRHIEDHQ